MGDSLVTAARKPTAHTSFFTAHILLRSDSCDRAIDKRHNVAVAVYLCCAMATSCFLRSLRSIVGDAAVDGGLVRPCHPSGACICLVTIDHEDTRSFVLAQFVCTNLHAPALRIFPHRSNPLQKKTQQTAARLSRDCIIQASSVVQTAL